MPVGKILRVAVPVPLYQLFDYLFPVDQEGLSPAPGVRVRVPFGRRRLVGVLVEVVDKPSVAAKNVRRADTIIDHIPPTGRDVFDLCHWAAGYYQHPLGEVLATAMPKLLREGRLAQRTTVKRWRSTAAGRQIAIDELRRAPRQARLLEALLADRSAIDEVELRERFGQIRSALKGLSDKGLIEPAPAEAATQPAHTEQGPELTQAQSEALAGIPRRGFCATLLEGVTGSGKTEVYLRLILQAVQDGRQALVLVPEIGLTPQLIARFRRRIPAPLAVLHSGLNDRQRLDAWLAARDGEAGVVIGTRSAAFTPLAKPGLIVVDEEHDTSYKQQDGFRYSARDLAVRRAADHAIAVILGSATPSLESLANADQGRYRRAVLPDRTGGAQVPSIRVLDVRGRPLQEGLSEPLFQAMQRHLGDGGQIMLFLNRRGFAPTLMCHQCGWIAECRRCDARLTYHQSRRRLLCHHCGGEQAPPAQCPACAAPDLLTIGQGTERIAAAVRARFPEVGIARIDRDTTARKGRFEALIDTFMRGETRILVGTQMLAKGHHFPNLTLVGIVDADQGLFGVDFRAAERMAQLIIQVAGRAGRAQRAGEVMIQTHHPEHPLLIRLIREGYGGFARLAMQERRDAALPPFSHLALLRAESTRADAPMAFLHEAAGVARRLQKTGYAVWGPAPAPMERRAGRSRAHLAVQAETRAQLHRMLRPWIPELARLSGARHVRWSIDVDPQIML